MPAGITKVILLNTGAIPSVVTLRAVPVVMEVQVGVAIPGLGEANGPDQEEDVYQSVGIVPLLPTFR